MGKNGRFLNFTLRWKPPKPVEKPAATVILVGEMAIVLIIKLAIWDDLMWKKIHTKMTIPNDLWYTNSYTNHIHKTGDNFEQLVFECLSHFEIHCAILTPVPRKIQQELIWLSTRPPSKRLGWKVQQSHVVSTCIILHHLVIPMPGKQHLFQQAWLTNDKRFFVAMVRKCGSSAWLSTEGVCMSNSHPNTNSHLFAPH